MSAQKGKDLLLKLDSDGTGAFLTVAGLRSRSLALNTTTVDITHADSAGRWRELLAGAGARSAKVQAPASSRTPPPTPSCASSSSTASSAPGRS